MADDNNNGQAELQQLAVQKVYIKDASFEAPGIPEVFASEWKPESNVQLSTEVKTTAGGCA